MKSVNDLTYINLRHLDSIQMYHNIVNVCFVLSLDSEVHKVFSVDFHNTLKELPILLILNDIFNDCNDNSSMISKHKKTYIIFALESWGLVAIVHPWKVPLYDTDGHLRSKPWGVDRL